MEYIGVHVRTRDGAAQEHDAMLILGVDPVTELAEIIDVLGEYDGGFPELERGAYRGLIEVQPMMHLTPRAYRTLTRYLPWDNLVWTEDGGTILDQRRASGMRDPQPDPRPEVGLPAAEHEPALA